MKDRVGGLGKFLNEMTQVTEETKENEKIKEEIVYIDITEIETNPRNFYGLRDVEGLAGLIAVSHMIEPLTVSKKENGKYMLIAGHRRRAAVQKLLEEGTYTNRKLPCIVKSREKIKIKQKDGEIVEFDEDAVEMLYLIASNRGQREERTIDEKLQEVKYLEAFAWAIYKQQREAGYRGYFRNFFAEEILNVSKSQLQRIKAIEKLTPKVKTAIDENKISETAAIELSSLTPEEQDKYLEKILNGELKGTVQDIQKAKSAKKDNLLEEENEIAIGIEEDTVRELSPTVEDKNNESEQSSSEVVLSEKSPSSRKTEKLTPEKVAGKIIDIPEKFDDPQKEAQEWFYQEKLAFYQMKYEEARRMNEEEEDKLKAAQWGIRASVARYSIEELKLSHKKEKK